MFEHETRLAEAVRTACAEAAEEAFEDGGLRGLCVEGRWELALEAIRRVNLRDVVDRLSRSPGAGTDKGDDP